MGRRTLVMTPAVVERAYALARTHNCREAARVLGVEWITLRMWAQRRGVAFVKGRPGRIPDPAKAAARECLPPGRRRTGPKPFVMTDERTAVAYALAGAGLVLPDVAERLGVKASTLRSWAWRRGLCFTDGRARA